jgi:hypothetical protein
MYDTCDICGVELDISNYNEVILRNGIMVEICTNCKKNHTN